MPAPKVNGFTIAYTAFGGVILWSGVTGTTLSTTFKDLLSGAPPTQDQEPIQPGASLSGLSAVSSESSSASGVPSGTAEQNYLTIAEFLVSNGYSYAAAAGIVGCIAGESGGNPEANSGSGIGLIQWTGSNESMVPALTGNPTTDLDNQLPAILKYNDAQGASLIAMLNQITDPVQAADFYSEHFERPLIPDSDVRAGVAQDIYNQLVSKSGTGVTY